MLTVTDEASIRTEALAATENPVKNFLPHIASDGGQAGAEGRVFLECAAVPHDAFAAAHRAASDQNKRYERLDGTPMLRRLLKSGGGKRRVRLIVEPEEGGSGGGFGTGGGPAADVNRPSVPAEDEGGRGIVSVAGSGGDAVAPYSETEKDDLIRLRRDLSRAQIERDDALDRARQAEVRLEEVEARWLGEQSSQRAADEERGEELNRTRNVSLGERDERRRLEGEVAAVRGELQALKADLECSRERDQQAAEESNHRLREVKGGPEGAPSEGPIERAPSDPMGAARGSRMEGGIAAVERRHPLPRHPDPRLDDQLKRLRERRDRLLDVLQTDPAANPRILELARKIEMAIRDIVATIPLTMGGGNEGDGT